MRRPLLQSVVLVLSLSIRLQAGPPTEVSGESALSFVKALADDSFGGRKSGLASGRRAEDWVAERLRELGLSPGCGESWFQEMRATVTEELPVPELSVTTGGADRRRAEYGRDFLPLSYSGAGVVEAGAVFCGYGIHAPEKGRDDYAGMDVAGRVVVALRGKPPGSPLEEERQIGYKSSIAFERGAVGFLLVEGDEAGSGTIQERFFRGQLPAAWISRATADDLFRRAGRPPLAAQVEALRSGKPASFPLPDVRVRLEVRTRIHRDAPMRNVAGLWPGETDEVVVLGAHLDHLGVDGLGRVLNGADDNASGSATLLEVARAMAASGRRFRRGVLFVWFAAEEQGLLGSRTFVEHPPVPLEKIAVMLNTDMCGQGRPVVAVGGVGTFPRTARLLLDDIGVEGVEVRRGWRGGGGSDQAPFAERGVPAFFLHTLGPHPGYHTPEDDWPAIRPELLEATGRFLRAAAERAASSEAPLCGGDRFAEYLWHDSPIVDLLSGAAAPREMGIDLGVRWTDGDVNEIDAVLTALEAKGADAVLVRPGVDPDAVEGPRPGVLIGLRGAAAIRIHRPARRLGVTVFAPFLGAEPAEDPAELLAFAGMPPAILCLLGAPPDLDPSEAPGPILVSTDLALRSIPLLSPRKSPWLAVHALAPLAENGPAAHAGIAREVVGLARSLGPTHLLLVPGDPADPTYASQAPTLHPGVVRALLREGLDEGQVRGILGGNLLRILADLD